MQPAPLRAATLVALVLLSATPCFLAISGTVVDGESHPLAGAHVCYLSADVDLLCVETDEAGYYDLPDSKLDRIRLRAPGFLSRVVAATDHDTAIVLERAATLLVRMVDAATGEPLSGGEVFVTASTGRRLGPFPVNAAGVRVRSLEPGSVRVTAASEGYEQHGEVAAKLVGGEESTVSVKMDPVENAP
jgi:hypothetical protein